MNKSKRRLTYREQLGKARQAALVAALREAARLAADGDWTQCSSLVRTAERDLQELCTVVVPAGEATEIDPAQYKHHGVISTVD